ncbi:MAG: ABC transporter substrate-binding protein [Haloarculaceae archaeon]
MTDATVVGRRQALGLAGTALAAGLGGCSSILGRGGGADEKTSLKTVLNWKPNPTQAGYYVARDRGYYDDEGLSVELVPGKGDTFAAKQVGLHNADLGLGSGAAVLESRKKDLPVRSYAAAQQRSNAALYTVAEQFGGRLERPRDLAGKRVAVAGDSAKTKTYTEALLTRAGVRDSVDMVSVGVEQQTSNLLAGNVDVATGIFADGLGLRQKGYDASMLLIGDYVPSVGRTIFARPDYADAHADAIGGFLRATAKGWAWAGAHPPKAESVMIDAQPSLHASRDMGRQKIDFSVRKLIATDAVAAHGWGWQSGQSWRAVHDALAATDMLPSGMDVSSAWTNELLPTDSAAVRQFSAHADAANASTR